LLEFPVNRAFFAPKRSQNPMARSASLSLPRTLLERFRPALAVPSLISALQAYGGLQAWAARSHRPSQSLGRLGALEVRLAQTAAQVRPSQKLRDRVLYKGHRQSGPAVRAPRHRRL
jgi:hypothetical protein